MELTMEGELEACALLAFRTPAESVAELVPAGLQLVTRGPWAFWNVVLCRVRAMRPSGMPAAFGVTYHHVAYRLYVTAQTVEGEVGGIWFARSDADAALLGLAGNALTDFRFHQAGIALEEHPHHYEARVMSSEGADVRLRASRRGTSWCAEGSAFGSEAEAREVLKYRPLGLSITAGGRVALAEVLRDEAAWSEETIKVEEAELGFFGQLGQTGVALELATLVAPLPYRWRLGRSLALARP